MVRRLPLSVAALVALAACSKPTPQAAPPPAGAATSAPSGSAHGLSAPPAAEVTVTFAMPRGDVDHPAMGAVAFNQPMVPVAAVDEPLAATQVRLDPPVGLSVRWMGTSTLGFFPTTALRGSTTYTVKLDSLTSLTGKPSAPHQWTFRTAVPRVVETTPRDGQGEVATSARITLLFDQPVDVQTVANAARLTVGDQTGPAFDVRLATAAEIGAWRNPPGHPAHADGESLAGRVVLVLPRSALPADAQVALVLSPGIGSMEGPERSREPFRLSFATLGELRVVSVACDQDPCDPDAWAPVTVSLNNGLPWTSGYDRSDDPAAGARGLGRFVRVTPPVPGFAASCYGSHCRLSGRVPVVSPSTAPAVAAWKPETTYTIEVLAGLPDVHGQRLRAMHKATVRFGHRKPQLDLLTDGSVLESTQGPHRLALAVRNVPKLQARAHRVTPETLPKVLDAIDPPPVPKGARPPPPEANGPTFESVLQVSGSRGVDTDERAVLDVDPAVGGDGKAGVAWVRVEAVEQPGAPQRIDRLLRWTDLHVLAKAADGTSVFWVTRYSTGLPVAGCKLRVQKRDGSEIWQGATNAQGLATAPGDLWQRDRRDWRDRGDDDATPPPAYVATAAIGDDWTYLLLEGEQAGEYLDREGEPALRGLLFTDKTLYKRGEAVQFKGIVRALGPAGLGIARPGQTVAVELRDPTDRAIGKLDTTLGENASFDGSLPLPGSGSTGTHQVVAKVGDRTLRAEFEVRVFRTPKFRMEATVAAAHHVVGEPVTVQVFAGYYSGGPLGRAPLKVAASGYVSVFSPPGWPEFSFGTGNWLSSDPSIAHSFRQQLAGELDATGKATLSLPTQGLRAVGSLPLEVECTAEDPNGQPVSKTAQTWVHPAAVHAGVRLAKALVEVGQPIAMHLVAPDALGRAVAGARLSVQVVQRSYLQVREEGMGGIVHWRSEVKDTPVGSCEVSGAASPVACAVTATQPGLHLVRATATDTKGRKAYTEVSLYVHGKGDARWDATERDGPRLVPDQERYKVGETAKILVKNLQPGAQALLTEERDGVLRTQLLTLQGEAPTVEVPIAARHAPNFWVGLAVFRGRSARAEVGIPDLGAPEIEVLYAPIAVDVADRSLQVQVATDRPKYRPRDEVQVTLTVSDAAGKPAAGEVALWAVDEGVMALSGQTRPDPLHAIYARAELGVANFAAVLDLIRGRVGEDKGKDGGGGDGVRGDFRDVPVWLPKVAVGADGKATARFALPDNLTAYRLMAVALSGPERAGSGETTIAVDKPVMLLATAPAQVHVGDEFEVALVLRNRSGADAAGTASATMEAAGGQATLVGPAQTTWKLAADAGQEIAFRARAAAAGTVKVTVHTQSGSDRDAVAHTIEIVDPIPTESVATYGVVQGPVREALHKSATARPGVGGLQVRLASSALAGLQGSMDWLMRYPYGCTEQLASQLQAFLWTERLADHYQVAPAARQSGRERAQQAIDKILANRAGSAPALALWPDSDQPHVGATAWALRLLYEAQAAGLRVDAMFVKDSAAWLRQRLSDDGKASDATDEAEMPLASDRDRSTAAIGDDDRAVVVATLAALGQPAPGELDALFARREKLSIDAQLFVAEAAAMQGGAAVDKARAIVEAVTRSAHLDAATAHIEASEARGWGSVVRSNALLLHVLIKAVPDHALLPRLARWLLEKRRDDRWGTTQDNAWALRGLGAWMQGQDHGGSGGQVAVLLGGKAIGSGTIKPKSLESLQFDVADPALPGGLSSIDIQPATGNRVHYSLRYTYGPAADAEVARNAGLFVQRIAYDDAGKKGPVELQRGAHIAVAVVVLADRDRTDVAIVDQLPAGLEPLDDALHTTSRAALRQMSELRQRLIGADLPQAGTTRGGLDLPWEGDPADRRELVGRQVRWFVDTLPAGVHVMTYVARAAVRGSFLGRGARAEAMYAPEVFGTSGPNRLTIR
ncbi:MAG: Ig-like domain-containing protein [Deltaproteobacteria bacterium]|nr:Ig-like domain-containing protein [Deltaproteobacteria bacterium]